MRYTRRFGRLCSLQIQFYRRIHRDEILNYQSVYSCSGGRKIFIRRFDRINKGIFEERLRSRYASPPTAAAVVAPPI